MDQKTALQNIIILLDDLVDLRKRLSGDDIPDIEIDLLKQQVISLYQELNRYGRLPLKEIAGPPNAAKAATYSIPASEVNEVRHEVKPFETGEALHSLETRAEELLPEEKKEKLTATAQQEPEETKPEPAATIAPEPEKASPAEPKRRISDIYAQARAKGASAPPEPKEANTEKSASTINQKLQSQQGSINERFAQQNVKTKLADKLKLSPISDLNKALSINQRVAMAKNLFNNDEKEFRKVINYVNGMQNFSEAKFYLQSEIAPKYQWDEENQYVQDLMELVYRKFL